MAKFIRCLRTLACYAPALTLFAVFCYFGWVTQSFAGGMSLVCLNLLFAVHLLTREPLAPFTKEAYALRFLKCYAPFLVVLFFFAGCVAYEISLECAGYVLLLNLVFALSLAGYGLAKPMKQAGAARPSAG